MTNAAPTATRTADIDAARTADEFLARQWDAYWVAQDKTLKLTGQRQELLKRQKRSAAPMTLEERIEKLDYQLHAAQTEAAALARFATEQDRKLYKGWSRFYLVGHIHRSTACSTLRATTRVAWLPGLSGLTEAEAVAEHGAILCTVCFPSAPTAWTEGKKDESVCPGSGLSIDRSLPNRFGYVAGNFATCAECGKKVGLPNTAHAIKKHRRP